MSANSNGAILMMTQAASGGGNNGMMTPPSMGGSPLHHSFHNNNNNNNNANTQNLADYLAQLIKDKKQLALFPNLFLHLERILDEGELSILNMLVSWKKIGLGEKLVFSFLF